MATTTVYPSNIAPTRRILSAGTLAGESVRNRAGDELGKIEDIMLDLEEGRVAYAVLSFGGFLGIGDKLFAVPWDALELNTAEHEFILDVDKQTLQNAPGFDKESWPDMADRTWASQVHAHYGSDPYWKVDLDDAKTDELTSATGSTVTRGNF